MNNKQLIKKRHTLGLLHLCEINRYTYKSKGFEVDFMMYCIRVFAG